MRKKKKKIQLTNLEKNLIEKSKNDGRFLVSTISWHLYHITMYLSGFASFVILFAFFGGINQKASKIDLFAAFTFFLSILIVAIICFIASREGPSNEKKLDKWKWKQGRQLQKIAQSL